MSAENPISPKAIASTTGAGIGAATSTLVLWILGVTVWGESAKAANVSDALTAVPGPIATFVVLLIPAGLAALLAYKVGDPHRVTTQELHTLRSHQSELDA